MLHQTVCCFVLSNPSRLCIMGSQWSFFRRRLTPTSRHTDKQTDRQTRSTAPVLSSAASALPQHLYPSGNTHFLLVQPSNYDCLLIWRLDKMQMKRDPLNGLLICLVRLYEEVLPAPWIEPCLFWTCITHVTALLQRQPSSVHTHTHTHTHIHNCLPLTPAPLPFHLLLVFQF